MSGNYVEHDTVQHCTLALLQPCLAPLNYSLVCLLILFLSYSVSGFHYSTNNLVITCYCVYMHVFSANTSVSTYLAFQPSRPLGFLQLS